ncbi:MAG: META domain-containing protein [Bacteroidota bacterium]
MKKGIILLFMTFLLCACPEDTVELAGTTWTIISIEDQKTNADDWRVAFDEENRFSAFLGCNNMFGSVSLKAERIKIGPVMSTKMACRDMNFEDRFVQLAEGIDGYKTENDLLYLYIADKKVMTLQQSKRND